MPRRDFLKATAGLVLATGAAWLATHAHGALPGRGQPPARAQHELLPRNLDPGSADGAAAAPPEPTSQS